MFALVTAETINKMFQIAELKSSRRAGTAFRCRLVIFICKSHAGGSRPRNSRICLEEAANSDIASQARLTCRKCVLTLAVTVRLHDCRRAFAPRSQG